MGNDVPNTNPLPFPGPRDFASKQVNDNQPFPFPPFPYHGFPFQPGPYPYPGCPYPYPPYYDPYRLSHYPAYPTSPHTAPPSSGQVPPHPNSRSDPVALTPLGQTVELQPMLKLKLSNREGRKPKWVRPPLPPLPERSPSPLAAHPPPQSRGQRKHEQQKQKRAAQKADARQGTATSDVSDKRARLVQAASTIIANFDSDDILTATSGYIGCKRVEEDVKEQRLVQSLDNLVGEHSLWKFSIVRVDMNHA
ncbi:hypothetical protein F5880DRAFT_1616575 [Lentinula raphanica]|nr:hypothetical protein F5880DRAFT_1616575 [Lentinula raphanica]